MFVEIPIHNRLVRENVMADVKQVIVMRADLKMRRGKEIAQGSHASMKVISDMMNFSYNFGTARATTDNVKYTLTLPYEGPISKWLEGSFTKVCLSVDSEEELLKLLNEAKSADIPCTLITDAGKTEFGGVPTRTCIAIGPWYSEEIDKITGHLKLR